VYNLPLVTSRCISLGFS